MKPFLYVCVALSVFWFFSRSPDKPAEIEPPPPIEEIVTAPDPEPVVPEATPQPLDVSEDEALQEARGASRSAQYFDRLPPEDQQWVLNEAVLGLKNGLIEKQDLTLHIQELSTVREFEVLERQMPMMDEEVYAAPEVEEG